MPLIGAISVDGSWRDLRWLAALRVPRAIRSTLTLEARHRSQERTHSAAPSNSCRPPSAARARGAVRTDVLGKVSLGSHHELAVG